MANTHKKKVVILQKNLPNLPKGRQFLESTDKKFFVANITDEETISGEFKMYQFTKEEIDANPKWFTYS